MSKEAKQLIELVNNGKLPPIETTSNLSKNGLNTVTIIPTKNNEEPKKETRYNFKKTKEMVNKGKLPPLNKRNDYPENIDCSNYGLRRVIIKTKKIN